MKHWTLGTCLAVALAVAGIGCKGDASAAKTEPGKAKPEAAKTEEAPGGEPTEAKAEEPPLEAAKLVLWHAYRADEQKAFEQLIDEYNKLGGPVTVEAIPVPYDAFVDKVAVTIPRGNGPDLFIFAHNMVGDWVKGGLIEPVDKWAPPELLKRFIPVTVKALVFQKSLYGLPLAFKSLVLYYNKKLVAEPPKTLDELIGKAKAATGGERYGLVYEAAKLYFHAPWLQGFGGRVFDADGKLAVDSPESIKAAELARSLVKEHGVVPSGITTFMVTSLFNEGKAAMAISGPWLRGDIDPSVDYGVALLPAIDETHRMRPFLGSEAVFISAKSAHKREAFDVAKFLTSDESARVRATVGKQPVANKATYEDPEVSKDADMAVFLAQSEEAEIMPAIPEMQIAWSPFDSALNKILFGDAAPAEALGEAQRKIESDIQKLQR